jgi:hypothetical protein
MDEPSIRNVLYALVAGLSYDGDIASSINRALSMIRRDQFESFFYLTIDDGPSADTGEKIRLLADHKIPAIWFCPGENLENYPETAMQLIESGHVIGNHSYAHPFFSALSCGLRSCHEMPGRRRWALFSSRRREPPEFDTAHYSIHPQR